MINPDLVAAASFVCILVLGVMAMIVSSLFGQRASARISARMRSTFGVESVLAQSDDTRDATIFKVRTPKNAFSAWLDPKLSRLDTVAGPIGKKIVLAATVATALVVGIGVRIAPLPGWSRPLILAGVPLFVMMQTYRILVNRFRNRFLESFPDVIDLIVRAVRAGIPVTHVIATAAGECPAPLAREFRMMGDALQVGFDLEEVLDAAMRRIEIADFSFFCVCLLLQRETGGQLSETLENLSHIVRTRREIRQKTRALTGEARITTKILTAIPIVIMLGMYGVDRSYIEVLFHTAAGRKLLTFAVMSVTIGLLAINRMSRLDTSR
jgi:tight adherence protein B